MTKLSKQHFELIADVARGERGEHFDKPYADMNAWERGTYDAWNTYTLNLAHALAATNPQFDRARFLAACGVQS